MKDSNTHKSSFRTFIALQVLPDREFLSLISGLKHSLESERIRWVNPGSYHITLQFLGETTEQEAEAVKSVLDECAGIHAAFSFRLAGLGVFRSFSYPRVLWIGVKDSQSLYGLQKSIFTSLKHKIPLKAEGKFSPHLSLGRMKSIENKDHLRKVVEQHSDFEFMTVKAKEVNYYESVLDKAGAEYRIISSSPLRTISLGPIHRVL